MTIKALIATLPGRTKFPIVLPTMKGNTECAACANRFHSTDTMLCKDIGQTVCLNCVHDITQIALSEYMEGR